MAPLSGKEILTGLTTRHLAKVEGTVLFAHRDVISALSELKRSASAAGFQLKICSSFRDFHAQLSIWNAKASGKRPLLDSRGRELKFEKLTPNEIISAILRWSALPGASRHHWGTDFDLYDGNTVPKDYTLKLIPDEFEGAGIFAPFHDWLDKVINRHGFFRPYAKDLGGVSPERWHLSFAPLSVPYLKELTPAMVRNVLSSVEMELKEEVLQTLDELFDRFIYNISPP